MTAALLNGFFLMQHGLQSPFLDGESNATLTSISRILKNGYFIIRGIAFKVSQLKNYHSNLQLNENLNSIA